MKKTRRRALYVVAALLAALFALSCLVGFAACGGGDEAEVESVSLNSTSLSIEEGKSATVTASVKMSDDSAYSGSYAWTTSDSSVATVSGSGATGTVTAVKAGSATVTLTVDNSKMATCSVTVTEAAPAATVVAVLYADSFKMNVGMEMDASDLVVTLYSDGNANLDCSLRSGYGCTYSISNGTMTFNISGLGTSSTGTVIYGTDGSIEAVTFTNFAGVDQDLTLAVEGYTPETGGGEGGDDNPGGDENPGTEPEEPETEATQVSTADELATALQQGGEIELTADIAASSTLTVSADTTIDLAGNTLSSGTITETTDEETGETTSATSGWTPVEAASNGVVSDVMISVGEGATLTIEDTSSDGSGKIEYTYSNEGTTAWGASYSWNSAADHGAVILVDGNENTSVTIESGTISSSSVGIRAKNGSVEINGGVIYSSGYYVIWEDTGKTDVTINDGLIYGDWGGILVDGDSRFKGSYSEGAVTTLTVNGGVVYSGDAANSAIRTESQGSIGSAIINVYGGYVICADNPQSDTNYEAGIFVGNGTLTIADGTDENGDVTSSPVIVGPTAIEVQGGTTTISGGTIISNATGEQKITSVTSSDPFTYGYALAINPRANISSQISSYTAKTDVTISGGTFVGDIYAIATANGTTDSTWSVSFTKDETGESTQNYVITIDASLGMTLTPYDSSDNPITDPNSETDAAYYLYTYTDLTSNFVTGSRDENSGLPDEAYYGGDSTTVFDESSVTSVERVGTTYIVSGSAAIMSDDQIKAFWGVETTDGHEGAQYIMVLITAGESDSFTIVTEKKPEGYVMGGEEGKNGFSMCFAVSDADTAEGAYLFTIVVDGVSFDVVLGTITLATTTTP